MRGMNRDRNCGCGRCGCNDMDRDDAGYGGYGRMHERMHGRIGMEGIGYMRMQNADSDKILKEKLELYKEELGEEIKYIEKRISELEKKSDGDDEDEDGEDK